jgi:hypothetical protein
MMITSWGRLLLTLLLVPLSWHAFHDQYGDVPLLSGIDLAIHEFGHMLFVPFGIEFLGDTAMVCLWWTSINLLSVAIYCGDARAGVLMLVSGQTGQESDGHDWNNLLGRWGMLRKDTLIAGQMRRVVWLLCVGSIVAGGIALWNARRQRVGPAGIN